MANRVALFIYGVGDLKGGGGAERFFADFCKIYRESDSPKNELYYIIDKNSVKNLNSVNKLVSEKGLLFIRLFSNRFKLTLEFLQLVKFILTKRINLIHIPLYNVSYISLLKRLNGLPRFIRPKLVINIVNCYIGQVLSDSNHKEYKSFYNTYNPLFKDVKVDGYFCWNQSFVKYVNENRPFTFIPKKVMAISSRFSDVRKFIPSENKINSVVFASRLDGQKHPDWFLKAILIIKNAGRINGWRFVICGDGPMREALIKFGTENGLADIVDFLIEGQMERMLNYSKIYVSCQDYDNFPSLSMSEAMASGNAILARDVGQTSLFVDDEKNGLMFKPDSPEGLATALMKLMNDELSLNKMGIHSVKLIKEVHNAPNFIKQIDEFWNQILE